MLPTKI